MNETQMERDETQNTERRKRDERSEKVRERENSTYVVGGGSMKGEKDEGEREREKSRREEYASCGRMRTKSGRKNSNGGENVLDTKEGDKGSCALFERLGEMCGEHNTGGCGG